MTEKRRCKAKTRAGAPCRSHPLGGTDFCMSHTDKETQAKLGFGGAINGAKGGEAKRVPRLTEILCARVEERAEEIIDKLFAGLGAERAVVVGTGPNARMETVSDPAEIRQTIREIFDRAVGRPLQAVELGGPDGGPIELHPPADAEDRSVTAARVLERARALEGIGNENGASSNGHG